MKSKILVAILLLLVMGAVALFLWVRSHGFSARAEPSWIEARLARHARRIATPANARDLKNPVQITDARMSEAREHFAEHCAMCHGIDGRGQTVMGRNLYPKVPPMTDADTQQLTDGELFYIISNGVRFTGMPAWSGEDSPESIWGLVVFIRRLPKLSPEEIKQMQKMAAGADDHQTMEGGGQEMKEMPGMKETKEGKSAGDKRESAGQSGRGARKTVKPHQH